MECVYNEPVDQYGIAILTYLDVYFLQSKK